MTAKSNILAILHLEDSDVDALLIKKTLGRNAPGIAINRVENEAEYRQALDEKKFDIILSDYSLPDFDGPSALMLATEIVPDIPFIFVSGAIGEVQAIESLKSGATDYVLKDNLKRLIPAIKRALREQEEIIRRREAEVATRRLVTAIEQAGEAVVVTDKDGTIQFVNPAYSRNTGFSKEEAIGSSPKIVKSGEHNGAFYQELWETILSGKEWSGRFLNRRKDGVTYHEVCVISPITDEFGEIINFVAVSRDITNEVALEEQLRQAQKMEAMGVLAASVAHDFNNLLSVIIMRVELIARDIGKSSELNFSISDINAAAERGKSLINQLMMFSRRQEVKLQEIDINEVITDTLKLLNRLLGADITVKSSLEDKLYFIYADQHQLEQVFVNLAVNARDAMPEGGSLQIQTKNVTITQKTALKSTTLPPGDFVLTTVADTGVGMSSDIVDRIFEPFFTTKEVGKGTGLGLATVYGVAQKFGGYIDVESGIGKGTTFSIYLPKHATFIGRAQKQKETINYRVATGTILLVEDDMALRNAIAAQLRKVGYDIHSAGTATEAKAVFSRLNGEIDFLVSDVILPDYNGKILAADLTERDNGFNTVFMSGNTDRSIIDEIHNEQDAILLEKPFTINDLVEALNKFTK